MTNIHLTKRTIESIPFLAAGQKLYRDDQLTGFGLRVGTRSKVFFVEAQVRRRTVRVTIGKFGPFTPELARREALKRLSEMAQGVDPNNAKRVEAAGFLTVAEAFEAFFAAKPNLSPITVVNYRRTPRLYLAAWAKLPIREITRQLVLRVHQQIAERYGAVTANNALRHFRSVYNYASVAERILELVGADITRLSTQRVEGDGITTSDFNKGAGAGIPARTSSA
jgi:hypothetical protein